MYSYDSKVYVYDISVNIMSLDDEAEMRCGRNPIDSEEGHNDDEFRCLELCHPNCLGKNKNLSLP